MEEIVNKVANSGLTLLNLEEIKPKEERIEIDLSPWLWQGLVVKEKEFRETLKNIDWNVYQDKWVTIYCRADAIIPIWAYMLVASYLEGKSKKTYFGPLEKIEEKILQDFIMSLNPEEFEGARIVIKGCSKESIPTNAYIELMNKLQPVVKSIFFGEPCSTVPVFKKK